MPIYNESDKVGLQSLDNVERALFGEGSGLLEGVVADVFGVRQHSEADADGADLVIRISLMFLRGAKAAGVHFSFNELTVQVKSSEAYFRKYWKNHGTSASWKMEGRIALEGEWSDEMIVGDFMLQVIALANGLRDGEVGQRMLSLFSPEAVAILKRNVYELEQFHGSFYAWLSGVDNLFRYGKLAEKLSLGI